MEQSEHAKYSKLHLKLCKWLKHDMVALELVAKMDKYVGELQEDYENLDPRGEK